MSYVGDFDGFGIYNIKINVSICYMAPKNPARVFIHFLIIYQKLLPWQLKHECAQAWETAVTSYHSV